VRSITKPLSFKHKNPGKKQNVFLSFFAPILNITIRKKDSNLYLKNNGSGHPVGENRKGIKSSKFSGF
jgi:hypothetical protein